MKAACCKGYLTDKLSARLMGTANTGSGRRESYQSIPMPRMTNTYMLAGDDAPEDILRSVKRGLYAVNFGGGQVDITNGKFVFSASEAYLIEDGKITAPVRDATLIGNGPEALKHVSMVGHDLKLDEGIGTCGKDGQSVPVGVGMPTIKLDRMTWGTGRKTASLLVSVRQCSVASYFVTLSHASSCCSHPETGTRSRISGRRRGGSGREGGRDRRRGGRREGDEFSVNVRMGEVETLKESGSRGLGLRVFLGKRSGRPRRAT